MESKTSNSFTSNSLSSPKSRSDKEAKASLLSSLRSAKLLHWPDDEVPRIEAVPLAPRWFDPLPALPPSVEVTPSHTLIEVYILPPLIYLCGTSLKCVLSPSLAASLRPLHLLSPPRISPRATMSSSSPPSLPENRIILGCGALTVDLLATVDNYPKPDDKIRSTSMKVQGGGNVGNALTCAARLGLNPRIISKVADDAQGRSILDELRADGVDTSFIVISREGNSPFTYVIVDKETRTRTCIHTPGYPPLVPDELPDTNLNLALIGASVVYLDGRLHETASIAAREANLRGIPILVDAEKKREGLDDLLKFATYVVCSARFPQAWTEAPSIPTALVSILLRLPALKFVIVTLGEDGCIMLERSSIEKFDILENDIEELLESLKQSMSSYKVTPASISSPVMNLRANGVGKISGRLLVGAAEKIPPGELVDTTGAGDAFIGAVLYALCAGMPPETMLSFAAQVAGAGCRALGARTGLPHRTDPRLTPFFASEL